jgi:hypothetical protein
MKKNFNQIKLVQHYKQFGVLNMRGKHKKIPIILVIAISFAVLLSSAYFCYYSLASADFISHRLKFETFDQDFLFAASGSEFKVFGPISFSILSALCINPGKQIPIFPFLTSPFNQRTSILRC